ncbi:hypothetical protein J4434_05110 [Candidatus Woesearchaeota archaeon]|nr:hypothetical protein [Candidatus Woesearchaeota archaeon]
MNIGIIGGSGANEVIEAFGVDAKLHTTDKHELNGVDYIDFRHNDNYIVFILRHGKEHTRDPARLDPRPIVRKLEELLGKDDSQRLIIQTSASGSLDTSIKLVDEGGIVVCCDVMRGFGFTTTTFSGEDGKPLHAVMANPFSKKARILALDAIAKVEGARGYDGGIYVNNQGNQFETAAEIAALYSLLDTPACRVDFYAEALDQNKAQLDNLRRKNPSNLLEISALCGKITHYESQLAMYQALSNSLNVTQATVSMNAAKEVPLLKEAGFNHIVLLSFPVNYGVGLIPDEKVDHERTINAITKATRPYIAPVLKNMIEMAREYIK